MNIFEIENGTLVFSPQALALKPFKEIWDKDETKDKALAVATLAFVYYMADDRSDYMHIIDEEQRAEDIVSALDFPKEFVWNTKEVIRAIHFYKKMSSTTSTKLLESTRLVIQKISHFLDNVDMDERDERTKKPIHDIAKITSSVEKIPKLIKALNAVEAEIIKEKEMKSQTGSREMAMFEGGV